MSKPWVTGFHDPITGTVTFVVADPMQRRAAVIDPVWDFDPKSGRLATACVDLVSAFLDREDLSLDWILETHVHADHLSAAQILKHRFRVPIGIGRHVTTVQRSFADFEDFWITALLGASLKATVATMTPEQVAMLKTRVRDRLAADHSGPITTSARANAIQGRVPS